MTAAHYQACTDWLNHTPSRARLFRCLFRWLPILSALCYLGTLGYLFWCQSPEWPFFLGVPALTFLAVTLFRKVLNAPRPYDCLSYTPFLPATPGKGKSLPSRHTTSAAAIALAFLYLSPWAGLFFSILALAVAVSRVIGGVHFVRDVTIGLLFSLPFALLYFLA